MACPADKVAKTGICMVCPTGEVPNSDQTGCIQCPPFQIAIYGQCLKCLAGQVPESDQTGCIPCPAGQIPNVDGTTCISMFFTFFVNLQQG